MFKKVPAILLIGIFLFSLVSCASIFCGTKQKVSVAANPSGADITIDGQTKQSPAVFILCTLPIGAFNTSRKQGKIWVGIALVSFIVLYYSEFFGIPASKVSKIGDIRLSHPIRQKF